MQSSWYDFTSALKKQFYSLGYIQQELMDWKNLRQGKGQNVQNYTQELRKRALRLRISLYTQETLLKYIGGLHGYLRHTIIMFGPTNFDELCVQATHSESRGKDVPKKFSKNPSPPPISKTKGKGKVNITTTMKKKIEKPTCLHCKKEGHDEAKCWNLHLELRPKRFGNKRGDKNATAIVQQDLGSDSGDETKITTLGLQGTYSVVGSSSITHSSKFETMYDERKRGELFHIRVISKHTKIDTLFDSGSQANLISEEVVKTLGFETKPHPKPHPLGWVCENAKLQVSKQCKLRFAITSNFIYEVELDVVPLDIYGIVLVSPYLYDRKAIFYREENKYHLIKYGIEYIVRVHQMKTNLSLVTIGEMKRHVNTSKNFVLMIVKATDDDKSNSFKGCDPKHKDELGKIVSNYDELFQEPKGLPPKR